MLITKTLYREFLECPKYGWFHLHKPDIYAYIQEHLYGPEDYDEQEASDTEEKQVEKLFLSHYSEIRIVDLSEYRWDPNLLHQKTIQALQDKEHVIYQGWLLYDNVYTIFDILLYDKENDGYVLLEIKSKNNIRKDTVKEPLKEEIVHDVSIQHYVLKQFVKIVDVRVGHLNKEYKKNGEIDTYSITKIESVITEIQDEQQLKDNLTVIGQTLELPEDAFERRFPYDACKALLYFWDQELSRAKGSIFSIPRITQAKIWEKGSKVHAIVEWHENGVSEIENIPPEDVSQLTDGYKLFIQKYIWGDSVEKNVIREIFSGLEFPLFFYDYETINTPIPLLDNTSPWQQVICQYSLHRLDSIDMLDRPDEIPHFEGLIQSNVTSNREVIAKLVNDIGDFSRWTFVVWHKTFECSRNSEIMTLFPEFSEVFSHINGHTFDLKDIVSSENSYAYFLRDFKWSASIKYVLPAMTDMTYEWMEIPNGKIAAETIKKLILQDSLECRTNLLSYCKQDTFAMVRIFQRILGDIA